MSFYDEAKALQGYLTALRREFHRHPCVSLQEYWTAERIERELDALGVSDHRRIGETGICAVIRGEGPGQGIVALRGDTDALPIQEVNTDLPYCSQEPGVMHACGHDAHTTGLLGAARLLLAHRGEFGGQVRLLFQHAEENGHGAKDFLAAGCLEGVDRVFGAHVTPEFPCGKVVVKPGPNNASVDLLKITIKGKAAHVSTPHQGVDALYIAAQTVVALQAVVTRRTAPADPVIVGFGMLHAGTAFNIVCETATLEGTVRAFSAETRAFVREQVDAVCRNVAQMYGGTVEMDWNDVAAPVWNPPQTTKEVAGVVADLLGPDAVVTERALSCAGDDFSFFQEKVPGVYVHVGTADPDRPDTCQSLHNDRFDIDERALAVLAAVPAEYAVRYLTGKIG